MLSRFSRPAASGRHDMLDGYCDILPMKEDDDDML